jgi:hypothetical protein
VPDYDPIDASTERPLRMVLECIPHIPSRPVLKPALGGNSRGAPNSVMPPIRSKLRGRVFNSALQPGIATATTE